LATHGGLGVYDFDDTHHAAVKVVTDGKQFTLAPGRHILISQNDHTKFAAANTAQLFAYRGIIQHPVGTTAEGLTQTVFTAEFDLPRAINTVVPLHQLITSTAPQARKIALRVLKTASILAELNTGAEEFHQVLSPCTLAMK
jgi:hypothetical protein